MLDGIEAHTSLRTVSLQVGQTLRLRPNDQLLRCEITDDKITVLIRKVTAREFKYQTCFDGADLWLACWVRTESGSWVQATEPVTIPDPDFQPYRRQEVGTVRDTPSAYRDRLEWEAMCASPGDDSRFGGRDSFTRVWSDESPMENAWAEHRTVLTRSSSDDSVNPK